ncbi:MAG TPA: sigma-54 dependent transcriptional regulator [Bryobacteraceae bacterium]|jgi:DNA-binding NtrC family response regulator
MSSFRIDLPHGFVGQSPQIRRVRELVEKVSRSRSPVLILGESGTGKEVVARAIHNAWVTGDFVPIDCGSLVGPLMESELFGHTRGAFTGASETKRGLIELADGGTVFFDEIGDLPLDLQVKLLRLLQEHEYRPVGSLQRRKIDLRVIAATHRNLAAAVEKGVFRQDLFYRLNVITIRLPPLRERKEDIPLLVERFLEFPRRRYSVTREVMDALKIYEWPGNVRELQNCIDRMIAVNSGPLLHTADLPSSIQNALEVTRTGLPAMAAAIRNANTTAGDAVIPLEQVERCAILSALAKTKGDRAAAAHFLGIGRTTLYRKLRGYGIPTQTPHAPAVAVV